MERKFDEIKTKIVEAASNKTVTIKPLPLI